MNHRSPAAPRALRALLLALPVLAWATPAPAATTAAAPDTVVVRVVTADGTRPEGLVARAAAGARRMTVPIGADGSVSLALPSATSRDTLEVIVDGAAAAGRYHPAVLRIASDRRAARPGAEHRVVLVPREWQVRHGRHAGARVEISPAKAYAPTCRDCGGFFPLGPARSGGVPGWREERFPLRVAFDRGRSTVPVAPADSAAFWQAAAQVEAVFGRRLFRPVGYAETLPSTDDGTDDVVLVWIVASLGSPGRMMTGFDGADIVTAALWLGGTAMLRRPAGQAVVAHELIHALGFGHTCAWRSVVADSRRCPQQRTPLPTVEDVAYIELALAVNRLARGSATGWGMEAALAGEHWARSEIAAR